MSETSIFNRLASAIAEDWTAHARPEQIPPPGAWIVWLILSGRGWGKTRTGAEWIKGLIVSGKAKRVALVGATASDVRDVMIEGQSGILSVCADWDRPVYEPSKRRITFKNGAVATAYSAEEPDRLRGPQHDAAWCDELAAWTNVRDVWDQLQFGLRLGKTPRCCVTSTPRPIPLLKQLIARPDVHVTKGKTSDNAANLAPTFLTAIVNRYEGTRLGRQELDGDILDDVPGALWNRDLLEATRVAKGEAPPMRRIVVAIDPAVSTGENSDLTGIIVAGLGADGAGYVIEDLSGRYSPTEWARRAIGAYHLHKADRIIAEANQGGAMVETTLRAVDAYVPVRLVHASRAKITRAEPISALFEQHKAHVVGGLPELEDELCSYEPGSPNSPDRLDAMVWALTDLQIAFGSTPLTYHVPPMGRSRSDVIAQYDPANEGVSAPPGGWPIDSPRAGVAGGFGNLGWSHNRR
jgi:predicted phage terminase large subunit-like protein